MRDMTREEEGMALDAESEQQTENHLLTRDQVLDVVRMQLFSIRRVFFDYLDHLRRVDGIGTVAWPDALLTLTPANWNDALQHALETRDALRASSSAAGGPPGGS